MVVDTADDPWADAAAATNNEAHAKSSFQMDPPDNSQQAAAAAPETEEVDPDSCGFNTLYQGLQVWHIFDLLVGFVIVLYGSWMARNPAVASIAVVFVLGVGILLLVRALGGTLALWTENACQRFGLTISSGTSPILACTWFVLMCINLVAPGHVRQYLAQHKLLWSHLQQWENVHKGTLTLMLLGAFIIECVRWQLVQSLGRKLDSLEAMEDARERRIAERRNRLPDRPWWWNRRASRGRLDPNDPLTDSLLPVTADRGEGQDETNNHPSWSFFGRRRRHNANNPREDASVGFASVQEEWASRAEEDPYWWSREEDNSTSPPTQEVSWTQKK